MTPQFRDRIARPLRLVSNILIATAIVAPCSLVVIALATAPSPSNVPTWRYYLPYLLAALGFLTIFFRVCYMAFCDHEERAEVLRELWFYTNSAASTWAFGGGLAAIVSALYFGLYSSGDFVGRFAGGLGIYTSTLGVAIGLHVFYRRTAPITSVRRLLEQLTEDLNALAAGGHTGDRRVWLVYPAPNLGEYRAIQRSDYTAHNAFRAALLNAASTIGSRFSIVCYAEHLITPMYQAYHSMQCKNADHSSYPQAAAQHALTLINDVRQATATVGSVVEVTPDRLPGQVVVIGDICYFIHSYGLPTWNQQTHFQPSDTRGSLAELFAYRRVDAIIANAVDMHLKHALETADSN